MWDKNRACVRFTYGIKNRYEETPARKKVFSEKLLVELEVYIVLQVILQMYFHILDLWLYVYQLEL